MERHEIIELMGVARFPVMKNLAEFDFAVSPVNQGWCASCTRAASLTPPSATPC